jgi:hypothetical protein
LPPGSSSLLPKLISALTGTTPTGATGSSSLGNIGGSTSNNYGSTNSAVAAGAVAPQGAPSAQMQQIASLLLQDPNQPNFNPLAYQQAPDAMTPEMTQRVAQQLQAPGQDAYFG